MKRSVLFVIESLAGGGAEKVLSVITKYFNYEKYDVTVCPIVDTGVYCEEVKKYVNHYSPIISYHGNLISQLWNRVKYKLIYSILPLKWVYRLFIPQGNDVEIAFCEGFLTKLLSNADLKSKKIAWIHTDLKDNPWPIELGIFNDSAEEGDAYKKFDKIVCVSDTVRQSFYELYTLHHKAITIYNPIDVDDIQQKAGRKSKRNDQAIHLISVGRLVPQKGYDRLLKAVKRLHDKGYSFQLTILGDGIERDMLEEYINGNDMHSYVSLPGFVDNPYQEMAASDIFVCSSRAEGFSLVIAEAMALGIPVISTYCSGPNELLQKGKCGMLVDNSENGIYHGLENVLLNKEQMADCIEAAREKIFGFSPTIIINQIEALLDD